MTTRRDPDTLLAAYLADGMEVLSDRVIDAVLVEAHRTRQRAVLGPWRTPIMTNALKLAIAAAAVVAVLVAGITVLPRGSDVGGPGPATPSPAASPSTSPSPSPLADRMSVAGADLGLTVDLPDGWQNNQFAAHGVDGDAPTGATFFVSVIDNTFIDPCSRIQRDPPVEPTVDAWAAALGEIPEITVSEPVGATIAGYDATYVELTIPASLPCAPDQFYLWQDSPDNYWWVVGLGEQLRVWLIDVDGRPIVIAARSWPGTSDATKAELDAVLDSIVFDTPTAQPSPGAS